MVHQPSMPSSDSLGRATQKASEFVFSRSPMILLLSSICCFFCWVFIYMFFCSKKCMFYMIWSCFIIRVIISSTCQALCPIFHAFFSASKWPWRIRIGTWAERHRAAEHWTWRPWKNAWFGLVWTSTEKLHIWWENPWLSYRCSTVQPKKQLLVWLGFSKRRFASCKRLHRRKKKHHKNTPWHHECRSCF